MSDEDQRLMEQISHLAGQINRAKNQQAGIASAPYSSPTYGRGGYHRSATSGRGSYRIGKLPVHRNRVLVLNSSPNTNNSNGDAGSNAESPSSSWVTRNDRHLQLINSNIYQEQTEARAKAIEQTRIQKLQQQENRERDQLMNHFSRTAYPSFVTANSTAAPSFEVTVEGIHFQVTKNGSKLVKLPGNPNAAKATPKVATIGGVKFYRTKNGNMYRQAIVKAQRRSGAVTKLNIPCKNFSNTGSCPKGPMCRYTHDPTKVSACKDLLQKGTCIHGDECDLSHDLIPERTPHCVHYAKGNCSKPDCAYTHRILPSGALVCRAFGFYGYCDKGISCSDRHSFGECPDFSNTGVCKTKHCRLLHRERASVLRKAGAAREQTAADGSDEDDLSSDDESVGSNDIDSDCCDEFIGEQDSTDFTKQKDFIPF